jgi:O-antigen/teichoic acid export membrane protein
MLLVNKNRITRGVLLGFMSMAIDALVGIVSYPLLLRYTTSSDVGIWVLYASLGVFLGLAQLGVVPSLTRLVATAKGAGNSWNGHRRAGSTARFVVAFLICIVAIFAFPLALAEPAKDSTSGVTMVGVGWALYVVGAIGRMSAQIDFAFVNAMGEVGLDKLTMTGTGLLNLALMGILVSQTASLVAAAVAFAVSGLTLAAVANRLQVRFCGMHEPVTQTWNQRMNNLKPLLNDSWGLLVLNIATFVVSQSCLYLVERWEGLPTLAGFGPIVRVQMLLAQLALLPVNMTYPFVSRCWAQKDSAGARRIAAIALGAAFGVYLLAASPLLYSPEWIISRWLGAEHFVGAVTVRGILAYGLLFVFTSSLTSPCLAVGGARFIAPALLNMVLIIPAIWFAHRWWGLPGVPAGMLIATAAGTIWVAVLAWSNFWKEPLRFIAPNGSMSNIAETALSDENTNEQLRRRSY